MASDFRPVKHIIILITFTEEEISEEFAKIAVIWFVVESERPAVVEVDGEFAGEAAA